MAMQRRANDVIQQLRTKFCQMAVEYTQRLFASIWCDLRNLAAIGNYFIDIMQQLEIKIFKMALQYIYRFFEK